MTDVHSINMKHQPFSARNPDMNFITGIDDFIHGKSVMHEYTKHRIN
jgi:hypothetical protein